MQYIYGYHELDTAPDNPTSAKVAPRRVLSGATIETAKSSTIGAVLYGEHVAVALAMQAAGSGAKAHTHPNEQFNFIVKGTFTVDVGAKKGMRAPAGSLVYFPANVVHRSVATPDEDAIFFVVKDLSHGITGTAVKKRGKRALSLRGTR